MTNIGDHRGHIRKADLAENITEKIVVLDIYRTPWSWTYRNDPGTPQGNDPRGQERYHHGPKGKT